MLTCAIPMAHRREGNRGTDLIEFTLKDLYGIQQVQEEKDVLNTLVNSLCPAIFGHELVKAGLLLGLFGGRQKFANDKNRIPVYVRALFCYAFSFSFLFINPLGQ